MQIAVFIVCRLKSERLKEKALKKINGIPLISHIINRVSLAKMPEEIILCTSSLPEDDRLIDIANKHKIKFFRDHPDDVLLRVSKAADHYKVENMLITTGDNPWVEPMYMDKLIINHINNKNDFTSIKGLPWGTFSYAIDPKATKKCIEIKLTDDTEVWHGYFQDTGIFKCGSISVEDKELLWPDLRLTVDTEEDFLFTKKIYKKLYKKDNLMQLKDIIRMLKENPELLKINLSVKQKTPNPIKYKIDH